MKTIKFLFILFFILPALPAEAVNFSFGASGGMEFPLWHTSNESAGPRVEAFYRIDPYEVRFHYAYLDTHYYSVLLGRKLFFSDDLLRPYVEAALGPAIVNTPSKGMAYGVSPEFSLGAELGINQHFSSFVCSRYSAYVYFGNTKSGSMEAIIVFQSWVV